jgi:taspase, threonine aspartase, 1
MASSFLEQMKPFVAIHVGAGYHSPSNRVEYKKMLQNIGSAAIKSLRRGLPAIEVLETVIKSLEDSDLTNSGIIGANMTLCSSIEADACIAGKDGSASIGAVPMASLSYNLGTVVHRYPISIVRALWDSKNDVDVAGRQSPLFLAGIHAQDYARDAGLVTIHEDEARRMISEKQTDRYHDHLKILAKAMMSGEQQDELYDTVGAIVVDSDGQILAGSSSGGISLKRRGRVGPAAIPGVGVIVEGNGQKEVALCLTGTGEQIIKTHIGRKLSDMCLKSDFPQGALRSVVNNQFINAESLINEPSKSLGAIVLTKEGDSLDFTFLHTTPSFCLCYVGGDDDNVTFKLSRLKTEQSIKNQSISVAC